MKKILMLFMMIVMIFSIYGCSAQDPYMEEPSPLDRVNFNWHTLSFYIENENDIFYGINQPQRDFIILYDIVLQTPFENDEKLAYQRLLSHLDILSEDLHVTISTLLDYGSKTIKEAFELASLEVTISDIVYFNQLKELVSTKSSESYDIQKIDYLEALLQTTLTSEQITTLNDLQNLYLKITNSQSDYRLFDHSIDDFIETLGQLGDVLSEQRTSDLTDMFELLAPLYT